MSWFLFNSKYRNIEYLFSIDYEKNIIIKRCLNNMQDVAKSYEKINVFLSNNQVNSLEKIRLAIKLSVDVIKIFEFVDLNE